MTTLTVAATKNYSSSSLAFIDVLDFTNALGSTAIATFGSWQFGAGKVSPTLLIDGSNGINAIVVNGNGQPFDASGWTFMNWTVFDTITINGSSFNDTLTGSSRADAINGGSGSDTINGGDGNDTINGGAGLDRLGGGDGIDTLSYATSSKPVTVNLASLTASGGDANGDSFSGFENAAGSMLDDQITGDATANALAGFAGNDRLSGGGGSDLLIGGAGRDTLTGGNDADRFIFSALTDSMPGGNRDLITDFSQAQGDRINLEAIDAIPGGLDTGFVFIGAAGFSAAGQVRFYKSGGLTVVQMDTNGDGVADMEIGISGAPTLVAADFIL